MIDSVIRILNETLQLPEGRLNASSRLLGEIPEFDSMAVVTVLTRLEDEFDLAIDDEDLTAETFESVGSLSEYLETRLA